ncbi:hypothetical protein [Flavobacterium tibetense]|uniref:Sulfur reduction protein DsrE n=1 Tax=Flavobacterium tibetense TaxID=2233533 RepID=A0A365P3T1_9FLAO|nr:hypothetical protein [Flavobacterium tibetense]RBA29177.1 hypothetical protein DPN68_03165 [Flavobacterium tibetense]
MKKYIIILTISSFLWFIPKATAQTKQEIKKTEQAIKKKGKYALLVRNVEHLKAAIQTGMEFKTRSNKIDFQIVICRKVIQEITSNNKLQSQIQLAINQKQFKILACGLSLKKLDINPTLLPSEMKSTTNGLTYIFGLQELGYKTITL